MEILPKLVLAPQDLIPTFPNLTKARSEFKRFFRYINQQQANQTIFFTTLLRFLLVRAAFITRLLSLTLLLSHMLNQFPLDIISSTLFHLFPSFHLFSLHFFLFPIISVIIHIVHLYNRISYHIHTVYSIWNHSIHSFSPLPPFVYRSLFFRCLNTHVVTVLLFILTFETLFFLASMSEVMKPLRLVSRSYHFFKLKAERKERTKKQEKNATDSTTVWFCLALDF